MIRVIRDLAELRSYVEMLKRNRITIGCVPTLGALHDGHVSLIRRSWRDNDRTVVTVFVNPLQFGPDEDLESYPRDLDADVARCEEAGANVVFAPSVTDLQPPGGSTTVRVVGVADEFEGRCRAGHFDGVSTVVAALFNLVQPDHAYFGQKDYQQTVVVRRMVRDLHIPVEIVVCPTVRDEDGLALSSRNAYLGEDDRAEALRLPNALREVERAALSGETDVDKLRGTLRELLESPREDVVTDYADIVHPDTMEPVTELGSRAIALAVLRIGTTRLLDNRVITPPGVPAWEA